MQTWHLPSPSSYPAASSSTMPLAIIELLTPVSEVMPSMFSTHTNEVEIIIGLLMTCWKMVPLGGLCLHFPQSLWALNLSAVSCATNRASLCFWLDRPATACSLQSFPSLMFSEATVTGLKPRHPPEHTPYLYCTSRCDSGPHLAHVMLGADLSLSSLSFNYQAQEKEM